MRDPALHITRSSLVKILNEVGMPVSMEKATEIIRRAKNYQISNRHIIQGTQKQKQKAEKSVEMDSPFVGIFQRILKSYRQELGHKSIFTIRNGDREYLMLKEIAQSANEFTETFKIQPKETGYKTFIQLGLRFMGKKYSLNRFKTYREGIFTVYENMIILDKDVDKEGTKAFYDCWKICMLEYASVDKPLDDFDMVNMIFGRQEADEVNAYYEDWVKAQFEGLAWLNAIPELSQFYGENAKKRYEKYIIALNKSVKDSADDGLPVKFESDEEAAYYKNLRNKNAS